MTYTLMQYRYVESVSKRKGNKASLSTGKKIKEQQYKKEINWTGGE